MELIAERINAMRPELDALHHERNMLEDEKQAAWHELRRLVMAER